MDHDELTHLRANYWCVTILCGLFLAIFLHALRVSASPLLLLCMALAAAIAAYFSMRLMFRLQAKKRQRR